MTCLRSFMLPGTLGCRAMRVVFACDAGAADMLARSVACATAPVLPR